MRNVIKYHWIGSKIAVVKILVFFFTFFCDFQTDPIIGILENQSLFLLIPITSENRILLGLETVTLFFPEQDD
jgi:hypothetical protein